MDLALRPRQMAITLQHAFMIASVSGSLHVLPYAPSGVELLTLASCEHMTSYVISKRDMG